MEPTLVEKHFLVDRYDTGEWPTVGPFDTYDETVRWRNDHDRMDEYRQTTAEVPAAKDPSKYTPPPKPKPKTWCEITLRVEDEDMAGGFSLPNPGHEYHSHIYGIRGPWVVTSSRKYEE